MATTHILYILCGGAQVVNLYLYLFHPPFCTVLRIRSLHFSEILRYRDILESDVFHFVFRIIIIFLKYPDILRSYDFRFLPKVQKFAQFGPSHRSQRAGTFKISVSDYYRGNGWLFFFRGAHPEIFEGIPYTL